MDLWGQALLDYHRGIRQYPLILQTSYGSPEPVPLEEFYRSDLSFNKLEIYALELCKGDILDIGAGAGAHSLQLQNMEHSVTALEYSPGACEVMKERGVKTVVQGDFWQFHHQKYNTLLLLMTVLALVVDLINYQDFLSCCLAGCFRKGKF